MSKVDTFTDGSPVSGMPRPEQYVGYLGLKQAEHGPEATPTILDEVAAELERAKKFKPFNSAHEGYAVLLEEVDELKAHVWMNQTKRDLDKMRKEAIQVAAMAVKFVEMMDAGRGRV